MGTVSEHEQEEGEVHNTRKWEGEVDETRKWETMRKSMHEQDYEELAKPSQFITTTFQYRPGKRQEGVASMPQKIKPLKKSKH